MFSSFIFPIEKEEEKVRRTNGKERDLRTKSLV